MLSWIATNIRITISKIKLSVPIGILMVGLIFSSCSKEDEEAVIYYNNLKEINNEIVFQIYKSLQETKILIMTDPVHTQGLDSYDYQTLKQSYDSITAVCNKSMKELMKIGPLREDSILYNTYVESLNLINDINKTEFNTVLECMRNGELNECRINALYDASVKIADNHVVRLDSILKFNRKYNIKIDTIELHHSKENANKFKNDISRIYGSKCVWGNCLNGYGQQSGPNGEEYIGNFKNGLFHGKGQLYFSNGEYYLGEFRNGAFDGKGTYTYKDSSVYKGEWRMNKIDGIGTKYFSSGDSIFGYWKNGNISEI